MGRQFETKHTATVSTCMQSAGPGEPEAFRAVTVVEKDGRVSQVALDPETAIAKCVWKTLLQETFPELPVAPFHDLTELSFKWMCSEEVDAMDEGYLPDDIERP